MKRFLARSLFTAAVGLGFVVPAVADDTVPNARKVRVVRDLAYGSDEKQKIDLYLPEGEKDFPVVLFFHGGGFSKGDRHDANTFGETFARHGVGVASAGYRLYPQAKHPLQIQDAATAFAWLKKHAAEHGTKADRLFVAGHSAGAHLATLLATDGEYLKAEKLESKDIRGVVALSGPYRLPEQRADVFGDEAARKAASPVSHVREGLPPFLLAYADKDSPGRDQLTQEFAEALKKAKVEVQVEVAKERDHGSIFTKIASGDPTGEAILAFVKKHAGEK